MNNYGQPVILGYGSNDYNDSQYDLNYWLRREDSRGITELERLYYPYANEAYKIRNSKLAKALK